MPSVCRLTFPQGTDTDTIESHLAFAIVAVECLFGKPRVRMDTAYLLSKTRPQIAIDVSTTTGQYVARIFTGLMTRELGEESFVVDRITDPSPA